MPLEPFVAFYTQCTAPIKMIPYAFAFIEETKNKPVLTYIFYAVYLYRNLFHIVQ